MELIKKVIFTAILFGIVLFVFFNTNINMVSVDRKEADLVLFGDNINPISLIPDQVIKAIIPIIRAHTFLEKIFIKLKYKISTQNKVTKNQLGA